MKKIKLLLSLALIMALVGYSCKKEISTNPQQSTENSSYSNNIIKRISDFRKQMNSGLKAGTKMHINDAVWNLEALISYDNAYPDSSSKDFITVSSYYTLNVDSDSLTTQEEVQQIYQQMLDSANYQLGQINASMKFMVFSDVKLDTIIGNTAHLQAINGYGFNLILGWYTPFTDDWIWGSLGSSLEGNCVGNDFTSDGSNEIQYRLNHPAVQLPGGGAYTDYQTLYRSDLDLGREDRIYWDDFAILNNCLSISTLSNYLTEAHNLIYNYDDPATLGYIEGFRPQDKDFISIEVVDEIVTLGGLNYLHEYRITYAKPIVIQN